MSDQKIDRRSIVAAAAGIIFNIVPRSEASDQPRDGLIPSGEVVNVLYCPTVAGYDRDGTCIRGFDIVEKALRDWTPGCTLILPSHRDEQGHRIFEFVQFKSGEQVNPQAAGEYKDPSPSRIVAKTDMIRMLRKIGVPIKD